MIPEKKNQFTNCCFVDASDLEALSFIDGTLSWTGLNWNHQNIHPWHKPSTLTLTFNPNDNPSPDPKYR